MVVFSLQNIIRTPLSPGWIRQLQEPAHLSGPGASEEGPALFRYPSIPAARCSSVPRKISVTAVDPSASLIRNGRSSRPGKGNRPLRRPSARAHAEQINKGLRHRGGRQAAGRRSCKINELTEKLLLDQYSPPCAIVNEKGDILYIHGRTGKYLEPVLGQGRSSISSKWPARGFAST